MLAEHPRPANPASRWLKICLEVTTPNCGLILPLKTERQGKAQGTTSEHPVSPYGAMSQQGSEFRGNVSAPQKFVHLVGCREPNVRPGLEARQYSHPVKR